MNKNYELEITFKVLKEMISKRRCEGWQKFVMEVGRKDPWSFVYRMQTGKMKTGKVTSAKGKSNGGETKEINE